MDPEHIRELSEREQLWASLRQLVPEIETLAEGRLDGTERQQQLAQVLARVVLAEMNFRDRTPD